MTSTVDREIVVLHSSPPHQQRETCAITTPPRREYVPNSSASEDNSSLPSVSGLWRKRDPGSKARERVGPLPLDSKLTGGSKAIRPPQNDSFWFQSVEETVARNELGVEEAAAEEKQAMSVGGDKSKALKETGDEIKPKKARGRPKTKADDKGDPANEAKPKAKRKPRAKSVIVSSHFAQRIETNEVTDLSKAAKPVAKRKSRAKTAVVSCHFDQKPGTEEQGALEAIEKTSVPAVKKRKRNDADETKHEKLKAPKRVLKDGDVKAQKPCKKPGTTSSHFDNADFPEWAKNKGNEKALTTILQTSEMANVADKRRKSWTRPQDTAPVKSNGRDVYEVPSSSQPASPITSKAKFGSLVGSFGFNGVTTTGKIPSEKVPIVGENKRRRIELIENVPLVPVESNNDTSNPAEVEAADIKETKKKSPKKAAFSITAKVTAKYGQPTVGTEPALVFPAHPLGGLVKETSPEKKTSPAKTLIKTGPKTASKPRAIKKAPQGGAKATKPKAKGKVTKPKKIVPDGQKLLSPAGIASRAQQQAVMFGTSSQLLTGDSPEMLRDLQEALRESTAMSTIQEEPASTAPVQRRLARGIRHTSGKMWAQQAESFDGDLADTEELPGPSTRQLSEVPAVAKITDANSSGGLDNELAAEPPLHRPPEEEFQTLSDEIDGMESLEPPNEAEYPPSHQPEAGGFVQEQCIPEEQEDRRVITIEDSPHLSSPADNPLIEPAECPPSHQPEAGGFVQEQRMLDEQEDEQWNTIEDSSPPSSPVESAPIEPAQSPSPAARTIKLSSSLTRPTHNLMRTAVAPPMRSSLFIPPMPLSGRTALQPLSTNTRSPKKVAATNKSPATSMDIAGAITNESPQKKKRGRPPKAKTDEATKNKSSKHVLDLQSTPTKDAEDKWHTLDDIEDSDPDMTPSPSRRGKKITPSPLPHLVTSNPSALTKRTTRTLANANHPLWPSIQAKLFPDITLIIKGQPRSFSGGQKLTWYEKMLLYDPIVIEDLTTFVNAEGVRIFVKEREEEVRGWMVQKWCEENSVCCLWRDGLRGGVRVRY